MDESYNDWVNAMNRIEYLEGVLKDIAKTGHNTATNKHRELDRADAYMVRSKARTAIGWATKPLASGQVSS